MENQWLNLKKKIRNTENLGQDITMCSDDTRKGMKKKCNRYVHET